MRRRSSSSSTTRRPPGRRALHRSELRRSGARRPDARGGGNARAEGSTPARHPARRSGVVPGLLRAAGRLRPGEPADASGARRRSLRDHRPEDLDRPTPQVADYCELLVRTDPDGTETSRNHVARHADGQPRDRDPAAGYARGRERVQRALSRRGARAGRSSRRRGERRLARGQRHPALRARHRVRRA